MRLELDEQQLLALVRLLDWYLPELAHEIGDTDNHEFRQSLKRDEAALRQLRAKVTGEARPPSLPPPFHP